jgi:hypothetical protein
MHPGRRRVIAQQAGRVDVQVEYRGTRFCDFASDSWRANPWADDLYRKSLRRSHDHQHAVRILARPWL